MVKLVSPSAQSVHEIPAEPSTSEEVPLPKGGQPPVCTHINWPVFCQACRPSGHVVTFAYPKEPVFEMDEEMKHD
jgi:hypothetical protein